MRRVSHKFKTLPGRPWLRSQVGCSRDNMVRWGYSQRRGCDFGASTQTMAPSCPALCVMTPAPYGEFLQSSGRNLFNKVIEGIIDTTMKKKNTLPVNNILLLRFQSTAGHGGRGCLLIFCIITGSWKKSWLAVYNILGHASGSHVRRSIKPTDTTINGLNYLFSLTISIGSTSK